MNAPDADAWATAQVQAGIEFLRAETAREWEEARVRTISERMADYRYHAEQCERRGNDYARQAAQFPQAHKDHAYYLRLANEQFAKAKFARLRVNLDQELIG